MNIKVVALHFLLVVLMTLSHWAAAADQVSWGQPQLRLNGMGGCTPDTLGEGSWSDINFLDLPQQQQFCMRVTLHLHNQGAQQKLLALSMLAASEIYWDGKLLATNGKVGETRATEIPGAVDFSVPVPQAWASAGEHQLLINASSFHVNQPLHAIFYYLAIDDFASANDGSLHELLLASFFLGGLLVAGLVFQILYWRYNRKINYQLLSALCLTSGLLLLAEKWRTAFGYTYDWHLLRLQIVLVLTWLTCWLLGIYHLVHYQLKHKWSGAGVLAVVLLAGSFLPISYDATSSLLFLIALVWVLATVIYAVVLCRHGAWWSLLGMTAVALLYLSSPADFLEDKFALAAFVVALVTLFSVVDEMRLSRAQALLSARMEAELLRKNLQPHFLMNSLMLAIEWIEQAPVAAAAFVHALADELGMLVAFSDKKLIALEEEIRLCERYIEIMSFRYSADYAFNVQGASAGVLVPPAVIHAQIENAFSHNRFADNAHFHLTISRRNQTIRLELISPQAPNRESKPHSTGFGERFIQARLQESFPDRYHYGGNIEGDHWVSVIEFEV